MIEVNSREEFKSAWKAFSTEIQRFQDLTRKAGGRDEKA